MRSPVAVLFDAAGNQLGFTDGQSLAGPLGSAGLLLAGKDGSNARWVQVDSSGRMWVNVNGTVAVSGTVTVTQGVAAGAAAPWAVRLSDGVSFYDGAKASQLPSALVGGRLDGNVGSWLGSTAPTVGQKPAASSVPVTIASDQSPIPVFQTVAAMLALPTLINLNFDQSDGALVANQFKRVITYTVPAGFNSFLLRYTSFQAETASSRLVAQTLLGSHVVNTNVFTAGSSYTAPQFVSIVHAHVTTLIQAGAGNIVLTVTYTNEVGTTGRVGTVTIPRGSAVNTRWLMVLASGDLGVQSIQSVSAAPLVTGAVSMVGVFQLTFHEDQSTTNQVQTNFPSGNISYGPGTVLGIEYSGGTVAKQRTFDVLLQLVAV